eukprot:GEZU01008363.1.p2 GENE.GEZU01008363.1~~GEZU01008363.1.p2  ORF type:complete len:207 (+),score=47.26 GEZU01008363.1:1224-1844(+)
MCIYLFHWWRWGAPLIDSMKQLLMQVLSMGVFLYLLSLTIYNDHFYSSFGFADADPSIGLCLFSYLYGPIGNAINVIINMFNRGFEYTCDAFAVQLGLDIEKPLIKLHVNNVYNLVVDKHYSRYYNAYPSLIERLEKIEKFTKEMKATASNNNIGPAPNFSNTLNNNNNSNHGDDETGASSVSQVALTGVSARPRPTANTTTASLD